LNSMSVPCIVQDRDGFMERKFAFVPDTIVNVGDLIHQDNEVYLAIEGNKDDIAPYVNAKLCNAIFPLQTRSTTEPVLDFNGNYQYDEFDEIITREVPSQVDLPCVVEN